MWVTGNASVFHVVTVVFPPAVVRTFIQRELISWTLNSVKEDGTRSLTEVSPCQCLGFAPDGQDEYQCYRVTDENEMKHLFVWIWSINQNKTEIASDGKILHFSGSFQVRSECTVCTSGSGRFFRGLFQIGVKFGRVITLHRGRTNTSLNLPDILTWMTILIFIISLHESFPQIFYWSEIYGSCGAIWGSNIKVNNRERIVLKSFHFFHLKWWS